MRVIPLISALSLGALGCSADAQRPAAPDAAARLIDDLEACRAKGADAARLACYDRAAEALTRGRQLGRVLVFDREKVQAERRQRFGLADAPADAGSRAAAEAAAVRELSSTVTAVGEGPAAGRWTLTLANGQVWQMLAATRVPPRKGASVKLTTTVTGGIRASVDGRAPIQVRRLR